MVSLFLYSEVETNSQEASHDQHVEDVLGRLRQSFAFHPHNVPYKVLAPSSYRLESLCGVLCLSFLSSIILQILYPTCGIPTPPFRCLYKEARLFSSPVGLAEGSRLAPALSVPPPARLLNFTWVPSQSICQVFGKK